MSRSFKTVPQTPGEIERFYLDVNQKLDGTEATLADIDQRSQSPVGAMQSETERTLSDLVKAAQAPLRAQIDELWKMLRDIKRESQSTKVDDLERRIDSIEKSARF